MNHNKRFKKRPLSYSQISSFEYSPYDWYKNYIQGIKEPPNSMMIFGSKVGDSIGTDKSMVPDLVPAGVKEYELKAKLDDIYMVGYCDHYCEKELILNENKTSDKLDRWNQVKVDSHKQLDMYCLLLWLEHKIKPEEVKIYLNFIPTVMSGVGYKLPTPPVVHTFETKRTMHDILTYANYIKTMVSKMNDYVDKHSDTML